MKYKPDPKMEAIERLMNKRDALQAENAAQRDEIERLREFVEGIAEQSCCETPGCSIEEPYCDTMQARALLKAGDK